MSQAEQAQETAMKVVINDEEQYSIWPADQDPPAGWHEVGKRGTEEECLAYIDEHWTDMRPASLRRRMDGPSGPDDR